MKRAMSALDAAFIQAEREEAPQHGAILLLLRKPEGESAHYLAELAAWMREHPVTAEPFNYVLSAGLGRRLRPSWTILPSEDIEIDYHFRHSALPQPGGELELATLVSRLVTHPVNFDRPPWELHLIEGLENDRFAILMKMHHAMVDGVSALRMLRNWLSEDPLERERAPLWAHQVVREKAVRAPIAQVPPAVSDGVARAARAPLSMASSVGRALAADVSAVRDPDQALVSPYSAPRTILNGRVTQRRRVATQRLPIDRFQDLARSTGGTLNDAVAIVLGTAMRRYLQELDELPERPLVAGVLTSLRATMTERAAAEASNAISMLFADLATEIDDISDRADRVIASTKAGKEHLLGLKGHATAYSSLMLAPFVLGNMTGTGHRLPPLQNVGLSNVPGTSSALFHNGAEVESLHATTIVGSGGALVVTVTSWGSNLCFTVTGCPDTAPHCQRVSVYLADALDEVEKALAV
ncbi:wax ester/triacylglycerol synthase family O-acyltransferase [Nocardioides limicola]|uniref:wax ester/triacylglycerol synthase family O-acyltransferase n=1 Tax=Nocardioides limicola TaxID=2803368 RepID=UPI00193B816F|nr:wax ester/triacylglycerol synthase family O-acyltransferase [Nocardioides sp. DJM-14]